MTRSPAHGFTVGATEAVANTNNDGDPFDNGGMWFVFAMLALLGLVTLVALGAIYYGDSVARPSWNERSVPAAQPY